MAFATLLNPHPLLHSSNTIKKLFCVSLEKSTFFSKSLYWCSRCLHFFYMYNIFKNWIDVKTRCDVPISVPNLSRRTQGWTATSRITVIRTWAALYICREYSTTCLTWWGGPTVWFPPTVFHKDAMAVSVGAVPIPSLEPRFPQECFSGGF